MNSPTDKPPAEHPAAPLAPEDLSSVVDHLLEGFQVIGPDFRYLYVNDTVVGHGKTTREALLGRTMMEAYPGIENTEVFVLLRRCLTERMPGHMENLFTFPDGSRGWFELRIEPVPAGAAILSVDITERKQAEAALERTTRALRVLSLSNQTLVRATDEHALVRDVCRVLVTSGGYRLAWIAALEEAPSGEASDVRPLVHARPDREPEDGVPDRIFSAPGVAAAIAEVVRTQAAATVHLYDDGARGDGTEGDPPPVGARAVLPVAHGGTLFGTLVIESDEAAAFDEAELGLLDEMAMDVGFGIATLRDRAARAQLRAERLELQARLEAAQRLDAVGRMAAGVAHDFNNLLGVILASTGLAIERLGPSNPARADLEQIEHAGHVAAGLARQLLAIGRAESGTPAPVEVNALVTDLRAIVAGLLGGAITIELELDSALGMIEADPVQIQQAVMNLAINARDAMPDGGRLSVRTANVEVSEEEARRLGTRPAGSYVSIAVRDTGHGMSPETLNRVFEPFFTTKARGAGTGLGLPTVYGIVRRWAGDVTVTSEPGKGTEFVLYLPRIDAPSEPGPAAESPTDVPPDAYSGRAASPAGTVLVVEDNEPIRALVQRLLERAGYQVLLACDGVEALEVFAGAPAPVDLVVTDVAMPRMTGVQLSERLLSENPGLRVLLMTGDGADAVVPSALVQAGARVIGKPFGNAEFVSAVTDLIEVSAGA